ncbi:hypothetical protein HO173_009647 [Letharia columbiana]|uniref:Myb-like DNA-binding domain-containing protein n=1 Tax=Letharia columbiana TaxID=112416 RepID=A0A8H6L1Q2_9LECA|nr:uncharacterized protein HO173_009647 [Letharia columbiana]KAF6232264.1 hypothetical protein HO173_009647 [Letharia columbiana]
MPTDGAISKFLYVIMKQLDLKSIDWQQVADQLDITNGHAARMRYSRFKQQMEGVAPAPRKARAAVPRQRTSKPDKSDKNKTQTEEHQGTVFKADKEENMDAMSGVEQTVKAEHFVKPEPEIKAELGGEEDGTWSPDGSADADAMQQVSLESAAFVNHGDLLQYSPVETPQISPELVAVKPEPVVKIEPLWEN